MASFQIFFALLASTLHMGFAASMDCGSGVALCGTLTLETGYGSGVYSGDPRVHGLWPETGSYGTSQCIAPQDKADPTKVYSCYSADDGAMSFQTHEWEKHGWCAGVKDADDFFTQVCSMSAAPVSALAKAKAAGSDFAAMAQALRDQGFPVWNLDEVNDQVELSACASGTAGNHQWVLAAVSDFPAKCGGSSPSPAPSPPSPSPSGGSCVPNVKGPKCSSDDDCTGLSGCVRCAHSGYCTDQPLFNSLHV